MTGDRRRAAARRRAPWWRTGRSGRASSRTRSGRSATPDRRWASRRRHRTAPRADGSSRRCRSRGRAARTRPRPRPPILRSNRRARGVGSCGLRVGPNAEFSVDEPIANSSRLVFATATAPAASTRSTTVAVYGGRQPSRIRDEHVVGTPRVQRLSFRTMGTPASGPGSSPRADRGVDRVGARRAPTSAMTRLHACSSGSRAAMTARCSSTTSRADRAPRATPSRDLERGHGSSRMRGTRKRPSSAAGAIASTSVASQARAHVVGPQHVDERQRVRGGRHPVGVERRDLCGVLEDHVELLGEALELVVGEREPGKVRDVLDIGTREAGHAVESRSPKDQTDFATMPRGRSTRSSPTSGSRPSREIIDERERRDPERTPSWR